MKQKTKNCLHWQHHEGALHVVAGGESCNYLDNGFFLAGSQAMPGKEPTCLFITLVSLALITALSIQ